MLSKGLHHTTEGLLEAQDFLHYIHHQTTSTTNLKCKCCSRSNLFAEILQFALWLENVDNAQG